VVASCLPPLLVLAIVLGACGRSALMDEVAPSVSVDSSSDAASPSGEDRQVGSRSPDAARAAPGPDASFDAPPLPAVCGPANCNGCCQGDVCVTNISVQACGWGGQACFACAADEICRGSCARPQLNCGPTNCDGCCGGSNICFSPGVGNIACGSGGGPCSRCVPTEGTGQCIANPNGKGGGTCSTTTCGPGTCTGCCSNGVCVDGSTASSCGGGGATCQACAAGAVCSSIGTCVPPSCSPETCAGCCGGPTGDTCLTGDADNDCGRGGFVCQGCGSFRQVCVNGTCVVPVACSPATCRGCCYGNICAEGDQSFLCGTRGTVCQSCQTSGQQCVSGSCR
jgi:hypothetical protein